MAANIIRGILNSLRELASVIVPETCEVCGRSLVDGEHTLCLDCDFHMPRCRIHHLEFNAIHQRMLRHVPIERAAAYFYYVRQSPYTNLILSAKYRGRPRIIRRLACAFAREIATDGFFNGIDLILPVPMHRLKRLRRGYNQTDHMARGISEATGIAVADNLRASRTHSSQTRKSAAERWENARAGFHVTDADNLSGKHLLIIDDVITTGATITACCEAVHRAAPSARISVLSIGLTNIGE